ncbi:MAG: nucleotide sugar dehydrogenase [Lentisphaerae bacterium]|jgi:UDPglucose 6-dehydrogenase|nr:nucleotide sugar dehydrogenase [Lentisphaerota bacterium]
MSNEKHKNILCIGAGYVGGPTMAMIAKMCPDRKVTVVDINEERIKAWQSDKLPIYEPGLEEVVRETLGRNLFFSTEVERGIEESDIIFVAVNTPTKTFGEGAGCAADLQYWEKTARQIKQCSKSDKIVVEKSTLPVKTASAMKRVLSDGKNGVNFEVLSNPEFLAEGTAIRDLQYPDRVLVGSAETPAGLAARDALVEIYAAWVPQEKILTTNVWSSELSKIAANAFLAQRISSINALTELCEKTGANVVEVSQAIGMDSRIGSKFLKAGVGFGGSCFKKDILNLVYMCESEGLYAAADYWRSVIDMNQHQMVRFVKTMLKAMFNTVADKRISILGFAFKADTSDTRESPAITVTKLLAEEHAQIVVSDPYAIENARNDLAGLEERVSYESDPYKAVEGADAVAIITDWKDYKDIDWKKIYERMRKPAFLFDGRNFLDHQKLFEIGFHVYAIGMEPKSHF